MPLRPCLDCGALSTGPRCPGHTRAQDAATLRAKRVRRPRLPGEDRRRAQAVALHRATYGDICPGYMRDPHPAPDLVADHPIAVSRGGDETQPLAVLCRSCNSVKSHSVTG